MSFVVADGIELGKAGIGLIGLIIQAVKDAEQGDEEALAKLERVEDVLSPNSPTERAFKRAAELAAGKPSRGEP